MYSEKIADRVREALVHLPDVEEKKMFRGVTFMVDGKMCVGVSGDELMCRINPDVYEEVKEKRGVRPMIMRGKELKGYVYVSEEGIKAKKDFDYWIKQCLEFNKEAKSSKSAKGRAPNAKGKAHRA